MNLELMPKQPAPQPKPEKTPKPTGVRLAQEMLVNIALGGDSQDTGKMLQKTVMQSVTERLKFLKADIDSLKKPPYSLDVVDPNSRGWFALSQKIMEALALNPEWKKLVAKAKDAAVKTQKPLGEEFGFEVYGLIADASNEVIRRQAGRQEARDRGEAA